MAQASWGAGFVAATTATAATRSSEAVRDDVAVVGDWGGSVVKDDAATVVALLGVVGGLLQGGEFHCQFRGVVGGLLQGGEFHAFS